MATTWQETTLKKASPAPSDGLASTSPQKTTFRFLPLKLRQNVYLCAAGNPRKKEIHVEYTLSGIFDSEEGVLRSDALNLLESLHSVAEDFHHEALEWLTSYTICWVLLSESQPHMYLIRALRRRAYSEILQRICRVRFVRVTVMGHTQPPDVGTHSQRTIRAGSDKNHLRARPRPAYLEYLGGASSNDFFRRKVKSNIGYGFMLVPHIFPMLHRLEIELDVVDCMNQRETQNILTYGHGPPMESDQHDLGMIVDLVRIGNLRSAGMIEVHVRWKDFGFRGCMLNNHIFSEHFLKGLQGRLMRVLRNKCLFGTSYCTLEICKHSGSFGLVWEGREIAKNRLREEQTWMIWITRPTLSATIQSRDHFPACE